MWILIGHEICDRIDRIDSSSIIQFIKQNYKRSADSRPFIKSSYRRPTHCTQFSWVRPRRRVCSGPQSDILGNCTLLPALWDRFGEGLPSAPSKAHQGMLGWVWCGRIDPSNTLGIKEMESVPAGPLIIISVWAHKWTNVHTLSCRKNFHKKEKLVQLQKEIN